MSSTTASRRRLNPAVLARYDRQQKSPSQQVSGRSSWEKEKRGKERRGEERKCTSGGGVVPSEVEEIEVEIEEERTIIRRKR